MAYQEKVSFDWLALWILLSAWVSISGWFLSAFGFLAPAGIGLSFTLFLGALVVFRSQLQCRARPNWKKIVRSQFWAPRIWLLFATLAFIGGAAYEPNNYDYLTYRFPRVLNWCWDHGWSWIPAVSQRMNYSGTGFEWLMVPLFIAFKTDRLFFLINFVSYLLLPGVIFSVFSQLGISKRISWWCMWILPCGYCYILQAASVGNDSFAAVYLLASLDYLFRVEGKSSQKNLVLSILAIALVIGAKASNIPLVLPWLTVFYFRRKEIMERCRPVVIGMALIVAAVVSFLPVALLNIHYTGDYSGDPENVGKMKLNNPVNAVLGNSLQLAKDNLVSPVMPWSVDWSPLVPQKLRVTLARDFPRLDLHSGELQIEEHAGIGLGVVLFASMLFIWGMGARITNPSLVRSFDYRAVVVVMAGVLAWLVYMSKIGSEATPRLIAAYYPLLFAGILIAASLDGRIIHCVAFKCAAYLAMLSAVPILIFCPARPLFPVDAVADIISKSHFGVRTLVKYNKVYGVYLSRSNSMKEIVDLLPPETQAVGFLQTGNDPEASLWRPFGARKVFETTPDTSIEYLKHRNVNFVVVGQDAVTDKFQTTLDSLLAKWSAHIIAKKDIILTDNRGMETWYLLGL